MQESFRNSALPIWARFCARRADSYLAAADQLIGMENVLGDDGVLTPESGPLRKADRALIRGIGARGGVCSSGVGVRELKAYVSGVAPLIVRTAAP